MNEFRKHPTFNLFVSNDGRVIGPSGKTRKLRKDKDGYLRLNIKHAGKHITLLVHRLVAETFLGPRDGNVTTVNHKNLNKQDNRVENLEYISFADNSRHAFANGNKPQCIPVEINGQRFYSMREAERVTGIPRYSDIIKSARK